MPSHREQTSATLATGAGLEVSFTNSLFVRAAHFEFEFERSHMMGVLRKPRGRRSARYWAHEVSSLGRSLLVLVHVCLGIRRSATDALLLGIQRSSSLGSIRIWAILAVSDSRRWMIKRPPVKGDATPKPTNTWLRIKNQLVFSKLQRESRACELARRSRWCSIRHCPAEPFSSQQLPVCTRVCAFN